MTGKKFLLGVLIFTLLFIISGIGESMPSQSRIAIFGFWIISSIFIVLLNNFFCRKWFSFNKLQISNYSWKQFGIIVIVLLLSSRGRPAYTKSYSEILMGAGTFFIFLGYLMFYLSDRYIKRRIFNIGLKAIPFFILALLFFYPLVSTRKSLLLSDLKTIHYMDVLSGERFEISPGDIDIEVSILSEFAKAQKGIRKYLSLIDELTAETIDDTMFIKEASQIEASFYTQIENIEELSKNIESTLLKNMVYGMLDFYKSWIFGLSKMKEGVEKKELKEIQTGLEIIRASYLKRLQFFKNYASLVRTEPGERIKEQLSFGLIRVEIVRIITNLEEYDVALSSLKSGDFAVSEFKQQMYYYESTLKTSFQKCDSLMDNIEDPKVMGIFEKYLGYKNIYSSVLYQAFQTLSTAVQAYMQGDLEVYNINYEKYTDLSENINAIMDDYLSIFLQE